MYLFKMVCANFLAHGSVFLLLQPGDVVTGLMIYIVLCSNLVVVLSPKAGEIIEWCGEPQEN